MVIKMEKFKATKNEGSVIELTNSTELERLYDTIESEENFILEWMEGDVRKSEIVIGTSLAGKVKNGDVSLISKEAK